MNDPVIYTPIIKPSSLVEGLDRANIFDYNSMPSFMDHFMEQFMKEMSAKKDAIIKQKLQEKGFGHLIEGMETLPDRNFEVTINLKTVFTKILAQ